MRYEESYQGERVVLTTTQIADGTWTWEAEIGGGPTVSLANASGDTYGREEDARSAARSAAAAAIDRARISRGKP
ncbi:hypothetical protein [Mycobacterium sp.]|uniref:hypothetical protein n=1 Tax=Mycobacterium sp. TaxID=1785 RepID=UPI0033417214